MSYVPKSNIRVKSYDYSNLSRASVVQFRGSRYIMSSNRTSEWKVMTIRISRELPLLIFRATWYIMSPNQTSAWKVMTIHISRELPLFKFKRLDILYPRIGHPCEKLWPLEFLQNFRCSISRVSIYYVPESNILVKCYDHLNFSRTSVVQFRASRYIISPNRTSVWNFMTIQIWRDLSLFNFEGLDILCRRIEHSCEK